MVGYNGYYGCPYCLVPGEYIKSKKHVYFPGQQGKLRNSEDIPVILQNKGTVCYFFQERCNSVVIRL